MNPRVKYKCELAAAVQLISFASTAVLSFLLNAALSRGTYALGLSKAGIDGSGAPEFMLAIGNFPVGVIVGSALLVGAFAARGGLSVLLFPLCIGFLLTGAGQAWLLMSGWQLFLLLWLVSLAGTVVVYWQIR